MIPEIDTILAGSVWRSQRAVSGVYFLIKDNEVVYVGQSTNTSARIAAHKTGRMIFDSYYIMQVLPEDLDAVEKENIAHFRPKYNIQENLYDLQAAFDFIVNYKTDNDGCSPSFREIGAVLGIDSAQTVKYILKKLEGMGLIEQRGKIIRVIGAQWMPPSDTARCLSEMGAHTDHAQE